MGLAFTIVQASGAAFVAAVWIASVVWTARDARRRCRDRGDVRIAITTAVLLPFAGAAFYALARPCEDPLEARERKLHLRLLEATLFDRRALPRLPDAARARLPLLPRLRR